ncbi:PKD domain-containing protein, partial [Candidatus Bathyarchaeota archaeon]|nr:PKD domain-containing protein [Candidatus Bathyarchaeota archaeon]
MFKNNPKFNKRGISTLTIVIVLVIVAVLAGIIILANTMGFFNNGNGEEPVEIMQLQKVTQASGELRISIKNVGTEPLKVEAPPNGKSRVYIDGQNWNSFKVSPTNVQKDGIFDVTITGIDISYVGKNITIRFVSDEGSSLETSVKIISSSVRKYLVVFTSSGGGPQSTINPIGNQNYEVGKTVSIKAIPSQYYTFNSWSASGSIIIKDPGNPETNITINSAGIVTANFMYTPPQYQVSFKLEGGGSQSTVNPVGNETYTMGTIINIRAEPGEDYSFNSWNVLGNITIRSKGNPTTTATINGPGTITANFQYTPDMYQVVFTTNGGGDSSTTSPEWTQVYQEGSIINITAIPGQYYSFQSWTSIGPIIIEDTTNPSTKATINGGGIITANYKSDNYTLTVNIIGEGTVQLLPPGGSYPPGLAVSIQAIHAYGWYFQEWKGDISRTDAAETVIMDKDLNITAVFNVNIVFAGQDQTVNEGDIVDFSGGFTDKNAASEYTATWDFGDGETSTGTLTTSHIYTDDGVYTVILVLTDADGASTADLLIVTVNNVAPTATLGNDGPKNEGSLVTVSFTGQSDPGSDTFTYSYDWNNDGIYEIVDQSGASATYTWLDNGVYTVKGRIKDDEGGFTEYTTQVTINNVAPNVSVGPDASINEGSTFNGSGGFTDPGADTWTATVNYGDASATQPLTLTNKTYSLSHIYVDNGSYTVTVTVTDDDTGIGSDTLVVTVNNVAPIVYAGTDKSGAEGSAISFSGNFTDPSPIDTHTISWTFGDGGSSSGSLTPTHIYMDNGLYTVTLTVTDDDGGSTSDTLTVTVSDRGPTAEFTSNSPKNEGESMSFTDASTSSPDSIVSWNWTFGDGGTSNVQNPSHTYINDGTYIVRLTITDDDGSTNYIEHNVIVTNLPPIMESIGTQNVNEGVLLTFTATATDPGINDVLTFSLIGDNHGASITAGGAFTWTPTEAQG